MDNGRCWKSPHLGNASQDLITEGRLSANPVSGLFHTLPPRLVPALLCTRNPLVSSQILLCQQHHILVATDTLRFHFPVSVWHAALMAAPQVAASRNVVAVPPQTKGQQCYGQDATNDHTLDNGFRRQATRCCCCTSPFSRTIIEHNVPART